MTHQKHRSVSGVALGISVAAVAIAVMSAMKPAQATPNAPICRWIYGELQVGATDAIFITDGHVVKIEGPDPRNPIQAVNEPKIQVIPPAEIHPLNVLGADGWEVVPNGGHAGRILLKRPF